MPAMSDRSPRNSRHSPSPAPDSAQSLIEAGLAIAAETGLGGVTLRPLADRAGVTVGAIAHALGGKDDVLRGMTVHARRLDAAWRQGWAPRMAALDGCGPALRALAIDLALDELTTSQRLSSILLCELLQTPQLSDGVRHELGAWMRDLEGFWGDLAGHGAAGSAVLGFAADETVYGLALNGRGSYRLLRRICAHRLVAGPTGGPAALAGEDALFARVVGELAPSRSVVDTPARSKSEEKRELIARAAGQLIVEQGIGVLTHRAVAAAADVAASSVVYHFGSTNELALAGLESVVGAFHTWLPDVRARAVNSGPDDEMMAATRGLVRATHAIALGAIRHDPLVDHAADMRRRRGENVRPTDLPNLPSHLTLDRVGAQVVSVVTFGARMIAMATGEDEGVRSTRSLDALFSLW